MGNEILKYKNKYLRASNSLLLIGIFTFIRTIFFLFKNESMLYLLEINRLINYLDIVISDNVTFWGPFVNVITTLIVSTLIFFIWKETQKGKIKIYSAFVAFYFLDMFLYFMTYDLISFILHFIFLSYMVFGLIHYKKMSILYFMSKNKGEEEK